MRYIWIINGSDMAFLSRDDVKAFQAKANSEPLKYDFVCDSDIERLIIYDANGEPKK